MKTRALMLVICLCFLAGLIAVSAAPVKLPERTAVKVALLETLVSGHGKPNDEVRFELREDLFGPSRELLATKGTAAFGHIIRTRKRGAFGRSGKLEFSCDYVTAVDGTKIQLRGSEAKSGRGNGGTAIATAVLLTPVALLINGRDVKADKGTEYTMYVSQDTLIDPDKGTTGANPSAASTYSINIKPTTFADIAKQLTASAKLDSTSSLAVTWFELVPEKTGMQVDPVVSRNACDDLSSALSATLKLKLVDRSEIDKAVAGLKIDTAKALDAADAQTLGATVKAARVVTGSISDRGTFVVVTARIIDSQTGEILGTASSEVPK